MHYRCSLLVLALGVIPACDRGAQENVAPVQVGRESNEPRPTPPAPSAQGQPPQGSPAEPREPITKAAMLIDASDAAQLVGRDVALQEPMKVTRVVSDKVFFVQDPSGQGRELMVFLVQQPTPDTPVEGRYRIRAGDTLTSLHGNVQRLQASDLQQSGLTAEEASAASDRTIYIRATRLTQQQSDKPTM